MAERRHPQLAAVDAQIAARRAELAAWAEKAGFAYKGNQVWKRANVHLAWDDGETVVYVFEDDRAYSLAWRAQLGWAPVEAVAAVVGAALPQLADEAKDGLRRTP